MASGIGATSAHKACWVLVLLGALTWRAPVLAGKWKALEEDGLHDPNNPALRDKQQPAEALSQLPPDHAGNQVDWVKALDEGYIQPRTSVMPETKIKLRDSDVIMKRTGEMPMVRFPHRQHTLWLDCSNCHERLFKSKVGESEVNMFQILSGEKCGVCHGAVAFPLTECQRCHNLPRTP